MTSELPPGRRRSLERTRPPRGHAWRRALVVALPLAARFADGRLFDRPRLRLHVAVRTLLRCRLDVFSVPSGLDRRRLAAMNPAPSIRERRSSSAMRPSICTSARSMMCSSSAAFRAPEPLSANRCPHASGANRPRSWGPSTRKLIAIFAPLCPAVSAAAAIRRPSNSQCPQSTKGRTSDACASILAPWNPAALFESGPQDRRSALLPR